MATKAVTIEVTVGKDAETIAVKPPIVNISRSNQDEIEWTFSMPFMIRLSNSDDFGKRACDSSEDNSVKSGKLLSSAAPDKKYRPYSIEIT